MKTLTIAFAARTIVGARVFGMVPFATTDDAERATFEHVDAIAKIVANGVGSESDVQGFAR